MIHNVRNIVILIWAATFLLATNGFFAIQHYCKTSHSDEILFSYDNIPNCNEIEICKNHFQQHCCETNCCENNISQEKNDSCCQNTSIFFKIPSFNIEKSNFSKIFFVKIFFLLNNFSLIFEKLIISQKFFDSPPLKISNNSLFSLIQNFRL